MFETASALTSQDQLNEEQAWSMALWSRFATLFGHGDGHGRGLTVCLDCLPWTACLLEGE